MPHMFLAVFPGNSFNFVSIALHKLVSNLTSPNCIWQLEAVSRLLSSNFSASLSFLLRRKILFSATISFDELENCRPPVIQSLLPTNCSRTQPAFSPLPALMIMKRGDVDQGNNLDISRARISL